MSEYIKKQDIINAIANTCFWLSADNWDELIKAINGVKTYSFPDREEDTEYKNLLIKLENAEDVIRGLKEDLREAREELREMSLYATGLT